MTSLRIVMPVLDEGDRLAAALGHLAPLRARGAEVVVVDGGSRDASWLVACAHADRVIAAPQGRASQMNAGARGATAGILLFLHADTRLPPDADTRVRQALDAGRAWGRFDVRIDGRHWLLRPTEWLLNRRSRYTGIATGDQAIFMRREAFEAVGGFPAIPLMEDVTMSARLKQLGRPACVRPPAVTSARRWEQHGVLRTILLMWSLRLRYFLGADPQVLADRYGYRRAPAAQGAAIAILAKAPVAGLAKTRLAPALGARGAARVQRHFTRLTVHAAQASALGAVRLWCAPDARHPAFRALARRTGIDVVAQPPGDLGARLDAAMRAHFQAAPREPLLLIGTDSPVLAPGHLQEAARALRTNDAVMIPAEDGGYVLIGMRRPLPAAFEGIDWGTGAVAAQTRERLRAAGATLAELPPLWDVDEPRDWWRYRQLLGAAQEEA